MDEATARSVFRQRTLKGKLLAALQQAREERGEDVVRGNVMDAADLRGAFADMGDEVPSKDLFPLVQQADPDGEGVITLSDFLAVVELRRSQLELAREQKQLVDAYVALGGDADRDKSVDSSILTAVASDFIGAGAAERAMAGVVKHKLKAVQAILDMGGALDDDEMEELKDTRKLAFEELGAFASSLREGGADEIGNHDDDDDDDERASGGGAGSSPSPAGGGGGGGGSGSQSSKTRRSSKDLLG